ncbi:hypothetical protein BKI52_16030 [marine bacterium AO1-C]|nr:hypothetical protein BKI52_16030 [marine bacterium AO1-C]
MSDKTIAQPSNSLDAVERRNPFPGLRSFKYEESHLYFGRDNQIEIVLNKLVQHRFVAVVGTSGIGKSSFLYCGLFPTLFGDYQTEYSNKWEIFTFRPGESPIKNLAQSITNEAVKNNPDLDPEMTFNVEYSTLTSSSMGLVDAFRGKFDKYQKNYLIFVDQFEELFRFKDIDTNTTEETLAFIKLLLTATEQSEVPVYVALTMRSDFIGDCSQYPNLTNSINKSQFLIPQMTRNEKKAAVEGPVRVMGADIDERLVQQILNDVGDNADQLPIMQHALMRTWDYWEQSAIHNEPISGGHYEAIGGMKTALEVHANEAFNELDDEQKKICERIFKTITVKGDDGRRIRRPTKLSEIAAIAEKPIEDCIAVIDNFRRADRTLLMPPQEVPLTEDSVIDISHESLMRIWGMLIFWVDEEADFVKEYIAWAIAAENHQSGQGGLLRGADLQLAIAKRDEKKPNLAWGVRYHPAYERTMSFLDFSRESEEQERRNKERLKKRNRKIFQAIFAFICVIMVGALIASYIAYEAQQEAGKQAKIAADKAVEADKQAKNAAKQATIAAEKEKEARGEQKKAIAAAKRADRQAEIAAQRANEARLASEEARRNLKVAEEQTEKALYQKKVADTATREAKENLKAAKKARRAADNLRRLSIARAMGLRSKQITNKTEQALVAQTAYNIFTDAKADRKAEDPAIYDGLYYAIKQLSSPTYNQFIGHTASLRSLVPAYNNFIYSAGSDGTVRSCNVDDANLEKDGVKITSLLPQPESVIKSMSIDPAENVLAIAGNSPYIKLYQVSKGKLAFKDRIPTRKSEIVKVYMALDNELFALSGDGDGKINYWSKRGKKWTSEALPVKGEADLMTAYHQKVVWKEKNSNELNFYDRRNGKSIPLNVTMKQAGDAFVSLEFSKDGLWLAAGTEKGFLYLWSVPRSGTPRSLGTQDILPKHLARINNIAFGTRIVGNQSVPMMATGSWDRNVRIYELNNLNKPPFVLTDHNDWVWTICFSGDGSKLLAGCKDNVIRVWPTTVDSMKDKIANTKAITRNMTTQEWKRHVSDKDEYQKTFDNLPAANK